MEFYNITGLTIASAGHRRGAQMAILRVDHPDVEEFVRAKQKPGALEGFNISVAVTDAFMEAVYADALFPLSFGGIVDREIRAGDLWQKIMRSTWDWAEPGVFYVDAVNRMNNLYYCETIAACNPCGEQPLPPYGACLLGSFNLPKYLITQPVTDQNSASQEAHHTEHGHRPYSFDYDQLKADIPHVVRGMDNVNDRSVYPLAQQREEARSKRRMGLGVMGLANAGEALGHPYGSPPFIEFEQQVLMIIRDECYRASANLAVEKGAFPRYDAERYLNGAFIKTLSEDVYELIKKNGIRNSHLTSIAPTGTISLCADNVSGGIEPVFAYEVERPVNTPDGRINVRVADYGVEELGVRGKLSRDVTPAEHVAVLVTAQRYVDSAVSKTCNVTGACQWDEFTGIYAEVHRKGGKGCTTFNKDGLRGALLAEAGGPATTDDGPSCAVDESGRRSCE
jgi:ribonucleoside-diphosphate reductase alpha chain